MKTIDFQIPVRVISEANQREHWTVKNRRKKEQQVTTAVAFLNNVRRSNINFPCVVKLTRIAPKALDSDNLAGSFKHVQDEIARKLGIDDGDAGKVIWEYAQMPVRIRQYSVKVEITTKESQ